MGIGIWMAIGYVSGFILTLIILHKTDGFWGEWNHYDPPHDSDHDDYESNASAYLAFSFCWPLFVPANLIKFGHQLLLKFSEKLGHKNRKDGSVHDGSVYKVTNGKINKIS